MYEQITKKRENHKICVSSNGESDAPVEPILTSIVTNLPAWSLKKELCTSPNDINYCTLCRGILGAARSVCIALFDWTGDRSHSSTGCYRLTGCRGKHVTDTQHLTVNYKVILKHAYHIFFIIAVNNSMHYFERVLYRLDRRLWAVQMRA